MGPGRRLLAATSVVATLVSCGGGDAAQPEFAARSWPDGAPVDVADLRGSPVLLAGWATWCVPCERELPMLDEFVEHGSAPGLTVVAVNVDAPATTDDDLAEMLDRLDVDLPVWRDADQTFLMSFDGTLMPYSVLLDADGDVVETWAGSLDPGGSSFQDALGRT